MYLVLIILLNKILVVSLADPQVTISSGTYNGQLLRTNNGVQYNSFKGIKFASAKRFEEGVPVPDSNKVYSAIDFAPACYQDVSFLDYNISISEDCLYLNVYSPDLNGLLPVIVFIYGGSFIMGDTSSYLPDYFMETKRVVVVTITYRISAFGFLYFDDPNYPANLGFRDQILALRWVQNNIKKFGGDPSRVTINGQSAGGDSVLTLMHSPMAKGLFVGAISESGVLSSRWALQPRCTGLKKRNFLAIRLGCELHLPLPGGSARDLVECLRSKSPDEIVNGTGILEIGFILNLFSPIVEPASVQNPVISYFPWLNGTNSSDLVPWISGVNSNEGVTLVGNALDNVFVNLGLNIFLEVFLPNLLYYRYLAASPFFVTEAIKLKYHNLNKINNETELGIDLITDSFFNYPLVRILKPIRSPTYIYYFNYTQPSETQGVGHTGELKYIWPNSTQYLTLEANGTQNDIQLSRNMVNAWIDFAYNQVPTFSNFTWERYDHRIDEVFIIDNEGARMELNPNNQTNEFWQTLHIDDSPKTELCFLY